MQDHNILDFDSHIGFWIEGAPYMWIPGNSDAQDSKRIYISAFPNSRTAIFDSNDSSVSNGEVSDNSVENAYSILPLGEKGCSLVRNCFLTSVGLKFESKYPIRIEGKPRKDSGYVKAPIFSPTITIIDPQSGFRDSIDLYKSPVKRDYKLTPNFLPTKVVYNKDSRYIAQKITRDRKKIDTKDLLRAFYKKNEAEQTWSTNKTTNSKHYEWFTKFTSTFQNPIYVDIGCGSGKDAYHISSEINAQHALCVDVKDSRVSDAKTLDFMLINEREPLNLNDNTIDIITLFHTIHHMEDAEFRLKDIYRILVPGGLLIIKDHNVQTQTDADNVTFEHFVYSIGEGEATVDDVDTYKDILPMYYYSANNILQYLQHLGFEEVYMNTYTNATRTHNAVFRK